MANLGDMSTFLKSKDLKDGDILVFDDGGEIKNVDFSKSKDGSDVKRVFQISVDTGNGIKKMTVNRTSQKALAGAWGSDTDAWVGKEAKVNLVKMSSFGEVKDVVVLEAITSVDSKEAGFPE